MRYFLYYGLIGNWIVSQFKTGSVLRILIAFCIIVLGAIVCDWILTDLKKKGENLLYIGAVCGYVLIYGLIILGVSCVFIFIILMVDVLGDVQKYIFPEMLEETNEDFRKLLWEELLFSDKVLRCLDYDHQNLYKYDLDSMFNDDSCTVEEAKEQIKKWDFYLDNPMEGSEKWKEQHLDD